MPIRLRLRPLTLRKFFSASLLGLAALHGVAAAQSCAAFDPTTVPQDLMAERAQHLQADVALCQKDAPWLAALGHLLNRMGSYAAAAEHLERALMLDPTLPQARLHYAVSLAGMGDTASAYAAVQGLLAEPDLPPQLQQVLRRQLAAWAPQSVNLAAWHMAGYVGVRLGTESNLLAAPDLTSLTLTFPGQSQDLPLDETYRPRPGGYQQADAQLQLRKATETAVWDVGASLRSRSSNVVNNVGLSQIDLTVERSTRAFYTQASAFVLDAQSGTRFEALGAAAGWARVWGAPAGNAANQNTTPSCLTRFGLETQDRSYTSNALLSGRYGGITGMVACSHNSGAQWQLGLKAGRDVADTSERAGGDQTQTSVRLVSLMPASALQLPAKGSLLADLELASSTDSAPYSPLLQSGSVRQLQRQSARLEWQLPLAKATQLALGADWVNQQSSLALFAVQNRGIYTALRYSW